MDNRDIPLLFDLISKDDREAFNKLFHAYFERLVNYAAIYLETFPDAEDIVAEFFMQLWRKRGSLSNIKSPVPYLYIAVKNRCLNHLRNSDKKVCEKVKEDDGLGFWPMDIEAQELKKVLISAIKALPEQRKVVFILMKMNGYKNIEVAKELNISVRTVENQLYKAVKQLAESLSGYLGYDPRKRNSNESQKLLHLFF